MNNHTRLPQLNKQGGFVLTIELILITTILIIGTFVGIVAIRDALVKHQVAQQNREITLIDSNQLRLGRMLTLNEHETPLIPLIDNSIPPLAPDPAHQSFRAIIGVRDDRFTSREPVYYDGPNCTGNPCMKGISDETTDSLGVEKLQATGAVSYLHALQAGPNYAIGRSLDGIRGDLYRTAGMCPIEPSQLQSRYMSQRVVSGTPCESFQVEQVAADTSCLAGIETGLSVIEIAPEVDNPVCEQCPAGTESQGDIIERYLPTVVPLVNQVLDVVAVEGVEVIIGDVCCPFGTQLEDDDGIVNALVYIALQEALGLLGIDLNDNKDLRKILKTLGIVEGQLNCVANISLLSAESVLDPLDNTQNILDRFTPPFRINLPSSSSDDEWFYVAPDGEGAN
jgi:hypothetical protein